jgi:hypothetical protein
MKSVCVNCITNSCFWNTCVTGQGINYKLPGDDTIVSKHVGGVIICEIIVHFWSQYKIQKRCTNVHYMYISALLKEIVSFIHDWVQLSFVITVVTNYSREKKDYYSVLITGRRLGMRGAIPPLTLTSLLRDTSYLINRGTTLISLCVTFFLVTFPWAEVIRFSCQGALCSSDISTFLSSNIKLNFPATLYASVFIRDSNLRASSQ